MHCFRLKGSTFVRKKCEKHTSCMVKMYSGSDVNNGVCCAVNRRAKKEEKSGKKRLTNENYGGNITKLSRETRVKTK